MRNTDREGLQTPRGAPAAALLVGVDRIYVEDPQTAQTREVTGSAQHAKRAKQNHVDHQGNGRHTVWPSLVPLSHECSTGQYQNRSLRHCCLLICTNVDASRNISCADNRAKLMYSRKRKQQKTAGDRRKQQKTDYMLRSRRFWSVSIKLQFRFRGQMVIGDGLIKPYPSRNCGH